MKLSIITINYNDAKGLAKTLKSVADQHIPDGFELEHIIIDGGSMDASVQVVRDYESSISNKHLAICLRWISEKDNGIYNAMNKGIEIALGLRVVDSFNRSKRSEDKNKGIEIATGDYIQILNSGDILASDDVICKMENVICERNVKPEMICGNMLKQLPNGKIIRDDNGRCEDMSFFRFFVATLNHNCVWIKRDLFDKFGLYDESLNIVSDWKWYLQVIALAGIKPMYVDVDMTLFDMTGISECNLELRNIEREQVLRGIMPAAIYEDYIARTFDMEQMTRLHRHPWAYKLVWVLERVLRRIENRCQK